MITLHHLNKSRSKRIIWLLEELGIDYEIKAYQRDSETFLAPLELKEIHPLGKSPVLEDDGVVIAESGAITEHLIEKFAPQRLAPERSSVEYVNYKQWMHFAESSGIFPVLLKYFVDRDGCETNFMGGYAEMEKGKILSYLNDCLEGKKYLVGEKLSGADIMISFIVELIPAVDDGLEKYPNIAKYAKQLASHPTFRKADELEKRYDESVS